MVHGWLAQAALDLALVSAIEHKPEYAAKAAEILLKYAEAYPGPHTTTVAGGMIYQSLDEAMWVIPLAQAYDLVYGRLTAARAGQDREVPAHGRRGHPMLRHRGQLGVVAPVRRRGDWLRH